MRTLALLVLLTACSSSASSGTSDATNSNPPDGAVGLTCASTIAAYCGANSCDQDLAAAKQDKALCPASLNTCGDFDVITRSHVDTATSYFYQGGQLVAIDNLLLPNHHSCIAGPATFAEPSCGSSSQTLPACIM